MCMIRLEVNGISIYQNPTVINFILNGDSLNDFRLIMILFGDLRIFYLDRIWYESPTDSVQSSEFKLLFVWMPEWIVATSHRIEIILVIDFKRLWNKPISFRNWTSKPFQNTNLFGKWSGFPLESKTAQSA